MNDNDIDKICEGCLSYERVGTKMPNSKLVYGMCRGYEIRDVNCPCQNCLIKAMCNIVCEAFIKTLWYEPPNIKV